MPNGNRITSLDRGFKIIATVGSIGPAKIKEVSSEVDMPESTVHIYLKTLVDLGYIIHDKDGYRLSLRFLEHGGKIRQQMKLYRVAKPVLNNMVQDTGDVCALGVEESGQRILLYRSEADNAVSDNSSIGQHLEMHCTALSKAILAHLPPQRRDEIISTTQFKERTEHTITTESALRNEIEQIRDKGHALEDEEREVGIRSIAVPLTDDENAVIGSISIAGPKERISNDRIHDELLERLRSAANVIEVRYLHE